jgi:hypothetical protein
MSEELKFDILASIFSGRKFRLPPWYLRREGFSTGPYEYVETFFPICLLSLSSKFNGLFCTTPFLRWKELCGRVEVFIASSVCHTANREWPIYVV